MPSNPTTKKGRQTRDTIMQTAAAVFARDGYVEARMLDIATDAGLSTGGLYRYFDNKTDVLAAIVAEIHEDFYTLSGHVRPLLRTDPLRALTEANRAYIEHYYKHREVMRVFVEAASIDERFRRILRAMRDRHVDRFVAAYASVAEPGMLEGDRLRVMTEAMTCMVEQCCYVWFAQESDNRAPVSVDEAVAVTSEAWFAAMFRRPLA